MINQSNLHCKILYTREKYLQAIFIADILINVNGVLAACLSLRRSLQI